MGKQIAEADKGWNKEEYSFKEYKTMGWFINGCKAVLRKVFNDPYAGDLTLELDWDGITVEDRIRAGEFVEYNHGMNEDYKAGFEFEFPDRIYAFNLEKEGQRIRREGSK